MALTFPLQQAVHELSICYGGDLQEKKNNWYQQANSAQDHYAQQTRPLYSVP